MSNSRPPCLFVSGDHTMEPFLDELTQTVRGWGVDVMRGPASKPGSVVELDAAQMRDFGRADVAMFSSRSRCTREMMLAAGNLHAVFTPTIGVETVDLAAARELGILVANGAAPENYISMAEASVMLILNLLYGLRATEEVLLKNKPRPTPDRLHAQMLQGKTVGIVGFGQIGREVARRLEVFSTHLLAYSPHADPAAVPSNVRLVDLETLLKSSDIVGLFMAITPANREIINDATLRMMKSTAFLVNVARGAAIDEPALVLALQERRIMGAALDTFAIEPLPIDSPLRNLDNVILTPHLVGHTQEGFAALKSTAFENVRRLLMRSLPLYCKNAETESRWRQRIAGFTDDYSTPPALA